MYKAESKVAQKVKASTCFQAGNMSSKSPIQLVEEN